MKVLIIDNYDSFTYNLYQVVGELLEEFRFENSELRMNEESYVEVVRNDEITVGEIIDRQYHRIIVSPGPGDPSHKKYFGVCGNVLEQIRSIPMLGVCLGMQGIAHFFGGKVIPAKQMMHGKTSVIVHDGKGIFGGVAQHIEVMRYHSLVVERDSLPACLEVSATAFSENSDSSSRFFSHAEIMGLRHKQFPIEGVQFHPESFATEDGKKILSNFLFRRYI